MGRRTHRGESTSDQTLAFRYLPSLRLLIRGGKLRKKDGWRNVVEHCVIQARVMEIMAELLKFSPNDKVDLCLVASIHDWDKRFEKRPGEFDNDDRERATQMLEALNPKWNLMNATKPAFVAEALVMGSSTFLERVQFFVDDICDGAEIVPWEKRLDAAAKRTPEPMVGKTAARGVRTSHWDQERTLCALVENEVFARIVAAGHNLASPKEIPVLLRQRLFNRSLGEQKR